MAWQTQTHHKLINLLVIVKIKDLKTINRDRKKANKQD